MNSGRTKSRRPRAPLEVLLGSFADGSAHAPDTQTPRDLDSRDAARWSHTQCDQSRDRSCDRNEEVRAFALVSPWGDRTRNLRSLTAGKKGLSEGRDRESRSVRLHALSK
eukprot:1366362-Prymnesium_polylepis.1